MPSPKPQAASGYSGFDIALARQECLYLATMFGDLMDDMVIVGGLVPSLLVTLSDLKEGEEVHVGTRDVDIGLNVVLFDEHRYEMIARRLRAAGFSPDVNDSGNETCQTWAFQGDKKITVDFLIQPTEGEKGGTIKHLEHGFGAIVAPALPVAFRDRLEVEIDGITLRNEAAARKIWVCGPGAFVVLKAQAFRQRGYNKDAYDLWYLIRHYGAGVEEVAHALAALLDDAKAQEALGILREDFADQGRVGPVRVATFLGDPDDLDRRADVAGDVLGLLAVVDKLWPR